MINNHQIHFQMINILSKQYSAEDISNAAAAADSSSFTQQTSYMCKSDDSGHYHLSMMLQQLLDREAD